MDLENIGARIKLVRDVLKIRQNVLSEKIKISVTTISDYEHGKKKPNLKFLLSLATQFDVSLDYLLLGKGEPLTGKESRSDDYWQNNPFGTQTEDVKKILWYMEHSSMVLGALVGNSLEYLYKNEDSIKKDIHSNEKRKREKEKNELANPDN